MSRMVDLSAAPPDFPCHEPVHRSLVEREERRYDQNVQNDQNAQNTHTVFMRQMMESLMTATVESKTYLPEEEVARRFADIVNTASSQEAALRLMVGDKAVELPPGMADVLVRVAQAMQQGLAVTVAPQNTRLTTQEAADMLGISRSTLVRMLDAGEIPFEKIRRHRRLYLSDVLEFQKRQRRAADEALSDMVADAQAMGAYDDDPAQVREALATVRAEN